MKKLYTTIPIAILCYCSYAQTIHLDGETFTYNSNTVYHYGLGWYLDPDASAYGPMAYFSAYGGIKFFTEGTFKGVWDVSGNLGIGTASPQRKLDLSNSGQLTFGDDVVTDSNNGLYWQSGSQYGIYRTSGSWTGNAYQQLLIQFQTGIQLGAGDRQ